MIIFLPAVEATLHPSMSTAVQASSAERRTSGRPRPPSPRCQHPYVAGSFTLPFPRHACHRARKDARRHEVRIPVDTSRPAIPKAWSRTLAVAPGSALGHSGACWPQRASWSSCGRATSRSGRETGPAVGGGRRAGSTPRRVLISPRIAGLREHNGEVVGDRRGQRSSTVPPMIG
jgi:hypothetical protein